MDAKHCDEDNRRLVYCAACTGPMKTHNTVTFMTISINLPNHIRTLYKLGKQCNTMLQLMPWPLSLRCKKFNLAIFHLDTNDDL